MIRATDRSPNPAPKAESAAKVVPSGRTTLAMFTISTGNLLPFGTLELEADELELVTEAIESVLASRPKISARLAKPGTRLIVTRVDPSDKDFVSRGGEPLVLGEVVTVPELVAFLKVPGSKLNASLVRYYLKQSLPFEQCGYTLRALDDFKNSLNGPTKRDHQAIAEAHIEWANENQVTPFV